MVIRKGFNVFKKWIYSGNNASIYPGAIHVFIIGDSKIPDEVD